MVNAAKGVLLGFYFFKGERQKDDYIRLCKQGTCMVIQKKHGWLFSYLRNLCLSLTSQFHMECPLINNIC